MRHSFLPALALCVTLAGCDLFLGEETATSQVAVKFNVAPGASAPAAKTGGPGASLLAAGLVIEGTNGTIELTDVRMIVEKFKLEREDAACDVDDSGGDDNSSDTGDDDGEDDDDRDACEKFTAPPAFVSLPLSGGTVTVATDEIPSSTYTELEFKVDDLDLDSGDDDHGDDDSAEEQQLAQALFEEIRAEFPDWPEDASMLLVGTFTPTGGTAQPFAIYAEAEIEVEMDLNPPLTIGADNAGNLTIEVDPVAWVKFADGRLLDLSSVDSDDDLLEFEVKVKEGFTEVEVDDDEGDDEDEDDDEGGDDDGSDD